jgi:hypothetical protein
VTSDGAPAFALHADASAVQDAVRRARTGLVDREVLTEVVALCAVAGEHLLVVGRREQRRSAIVLPNSWATQRPGPPRVMARPLRGHMGEDAPTRAVAEMCHRVLLWGRSGRDLGV